MKRVVHPAHDEMSGIVSGDACGNERKIAVSVIIPCLNEERTVATCVRKALASIESMGVAGEVVVSDNGSVDASVQRAKEAGACVVHCGERGYGAAIQFGVLHSAGDIIVMGDADDSYDFEQIEPFVTELQAGDTDIVMGDRFRGGIQPGAMPWKNRYIGNPLLSRLLAVLFGGNVHDAHCGLRSFTREAYRRISPTAPGMEFASELIVKALLHGLSIKEVPTTLAPDGRDRPPHLSPWRDGWHHLMLMASLAPAHACLVPAAICAVLGVVTMIAVNRKAPVVGLTFAAAALCWAQLYLLGRIYIERHVLRCGSSTKHKVLQPAKVANVFSGAGLMVAAVSVLLLALGMVGWTPALIGTLAGAELFSFGTLVLLLGSGAEGVGGEAGLKPAFERSGHGMTSRKRKGSKVFFG